MGRASPAIAAFVGGEWSPQMEGRIDEERYPLASHICQNFIPLKQGPAMFRAGTVYVQAVKSSANRSWLLRFEFSQTQAFVIEFGDMYARFYTNHGPELATGVAAYNNATPYVLGNLVLSAGIIYYCIAATTGNAPPNASYWYAMSPYNGSPTTAIYEIPSPYAAADLTDSEGEFALQLAQQGDVIYIAGGYAGAGYAPQTLTRYANSPPNWQFATYAPTDGPFLSAIPLVANQEVGLTITGQQGNNQQISSTYDQSGNGPGVGTFHPTDVGRLVRIGTQNFNVPTWTGNISYSAGTLASNNGQNYIALNAATSGVNPPTHTSGAVRDGPSGVLWLWQDSGYGVAVIIGYVSSTTVNVNVLKPFPASVAGGFSSAVTAISQSNPAVVTATFATAPAAGASVMVAGAKGMTQISNQIYTVQSATVSATTLAGLDSTSFGAYTGGAKLWTNVSTEWQLGAWSNTTEWPRAVAFFKDRLFWAGELNIWGSVPGLYASMTPDVFGQLTTDSAMNELVSGSDSSNICWLSPAIILLIGTEGGEYGLDAAAYSTSPLGPDNVEILRQSGWRCRHIKPELVGTTVLYVQRAGRKIFAMDYQLWLNRYDSTDQSKFSYHMTIGGLCQIAYQQEPFSLLWSTRADGTLLSYTFNREDQVTAWARHNIGGNGVVESIAVIPSPDGLRDELWMIVKRTINGTTARYVEYMAKHFEGPQGGYAGDAQSSAWYVDCGGQLLTTTTPGQTTTTVTGLQYLQGQTVATLADGGVQPQQVVPPSGTIVLTGAFSTITVGLPYQGNLVPMRPEGGADTGTSQGKKKSGSQLVLRVVDSFGLQIAQLSNQNPATQTYQNPLGQLTLSATNFEQVQYNYTTTPLNSPPPLQSGDFQISFPSADTSGSDQDATDLYILVQQNAPLPSTVCGIFPSYEVHEPR